jgi:hypothetical protein
MGFKETLVFYWRQKKQPPPKLRSPLSLAIAMPHRHQVAIHPFIGVRSLRSRNLSSLTTLRCSNLHQPNFRCKTIDYTDGGHPVNRNRGVHPASLVKILTLTDHGFSIYIGYHSQSLCPAAMFQKSTE